MRNDYIITTAIVIPALFTTAIYLKAREKDSLVQELTPFIEKYDGNKGISPEDLKEFGRRAGLSPEGIERLLSNLLSLNALPKSRLQTALNSYKSE